MCVCVCSLSRSPTFRAILTLRYDDYRGVLCLIQVIDGMLAVGTLLFLNIYPIYIFYTMYMIYIRSLL